MKITIFTPVIALPVAIAVALPASLPTSINVPVSQDPSPPRPFPKYPLVDGNPLVENIPLVPSRFPTDNEAKIHDPSPPQPFAPGRIVEAGEVPAPQVVQRSPKMPHKLVKVIPPEAFPTQYLDVPQEEEKSLEPRDPLSRFPTDDEKEAADPSPPRPFAPGRLVEVNGSSVGNISKSSTPSPLLRNTEGPIAEINGSSSPMPSLTGQPVEANTSTSNTTMASRTSNITLLGTENSTVALDKRSCGKYLEECRHRNPIPMSNSASTSTSTAPAITNSIQNHVLSGRRIPFFHFRHNGSRSQSSAVPSFIIPEPRIPIFNSTNSTNSSNSIASTNNTASLNSTVSHILRSFLRKAMIPFFNSTATSNDTATFDTTVTFNGTTSRIHRPIILPPMIPILNTTNSTTTPNDTAIHKRDEIPISNSSTTTLNSTASLNDTASLNLTNITSVTATYITTYTKYIGRKPHHHYPNATTISTCTSTFATTGTTSAPPPSTTTAIRATQYPKHWLEDHGIFVIWEPEVEAILDPNP